MRSSVGKGGLLLGIAFGVTDGLAWGLIFGESASSFGKDLPFGVTLLTSVLSLLDLAYIDSACFDGPGSLNDNTLDVDNLEEELSRDDSNDEGG